MDHFKEKKTIHEKISPDFERSIAYLDNIMVVVCDFKNGPMNKPDPPHSHPHEQITYVADGELSISLKKRRNSGLNPGI